MSRSSKGLSIRALKIRTVPNDDSKSMHVKTKFKNGERNIVTNALVDSGTQGIFMDERFAKQHHIPLLKLDREIPVSNVDDTPNQNGPIKLYA